MSAADTGARGEANRARPKRRSARLLSPCLSRSPLLSPHTLAHNTSSIGPHSLARSRPPPLSLPQGAPQPLILRWSVHERHNSSGGNNDKAHSTVPHETSMLLFSLESTLTELAAALCLCVLCQAKHHPDLIMCRKQPGIASQFTPRHAASRAFNRAWDPPHTLSCLCLCVRCVQLVVCARSVTANVSSAIHT